MTEDVKKQVAKYDGEYKAFGRIGKVMEHVLKDVRSHDALDNTVDTIAERLQKSGQINTKNKPKGAVKNALSILQGMSKVERKPVGSSALYKAK